jgi:short-subunit dehydrogenase
MKNNVTVITGASSGIGEAVSLRLSKRKYSLILVARSATALETVAEKCRQNGSEVLVVPADVSRPADVANVGKKALEKFGHIDVWINNASTISYSRFLDIPPQEFDQMLATNIGGVVSGSRVALQQFMRQSSGTLINIASGLGVVPAPYVSNYVTTKFAVRGFTASLMQELYVDKVRSTHLCCVLPSTIDTPIYQHAANHMGKRANAIPPVYSVATAARKIVRLIDHPKAELVIGRPIRLLGVMYACFPSLTLRGFARYAKRLSSLPEAAKDTSGNVFAADKDGSTSGGWQKVPK